MGEIDLKELHFTSLVYTLHESAMLGMGKIINPITQKIERNLLQAKSAIDILEMLKEKTKSNLNDREEKMLEGTLHELRLNYLEELKEEEIKDGKNEEK